MMTLLWGRRGGRGDEWNLLGVYESAAAAWRKAGTRGYGHEVKVKTLEGDMSESVEFKEASAAWRGALEAHGVACDKCSVDVKGCPQGMRLLAGLLWVSYGFPTCRTCKMPPWDCVGVALHG